jgi:hypothetical protein
LFLYFVIFENTNTWRQRERDRERETERERQRERGRGRGRQRERERHRAAIRDEQGVGTDLFTSSLEMISSHGLSVSMAERRG